MKNLPALAYAWLIIVGALLFFFPGGIRVCIACGSMMETVLAVVSVLVGVAGFAMQGRSVLSA